MQYIFYAILIYLLYRFIVGFVLPVAKATKTMKKQFGHMKEHMQQQANTQAQQGGDGNRTSAQNLPTEKPQYDIEGEYINFEEVKKSGE